MSDLATQEQAPTVAKWERNAEVDRIQRRFWRFSRLTNVIASALLAIDSVALIYATEFRISTLTFITIHALGFTLLGGAFFNRFIIYITKRYDRPFPMPPPPDEGESLVDIEIHHGRRFVGFDRGVAWFDGDLFAFHGHLTSFCLGRQDVEASEFLYVAGQVVLNLAGSERVSIVIHPLANKKSEGSYQGVVGLLRAWTTSAKPSDQPRQLPPLLPDSRYPPIPIVEPAALAFFALANLYAGYLGLGAAMFVVAFIVYTANQTHAMPKRSRRILLPDD